MNFEQSPFNDILNSEREMVLRGADRYGHYFINASEFINLLYDGMIKSIDPDHFIFGIFLSQIRKHLTLSLFSAVRLHSVQTNMNLRQVLEAATCAAYAIANTDPADFAETRDDGTLNPSQKLAAKRYAWLNQNFSSSSNAIKLMKSCINEIGTHSNIVGAHNTFLYDQENKIFNTPFFDYENERSVKTELWQIANITLGIMDLIFGVNQEYATIIVKDDWADKFRILTTENERLKGEMLLNQVPARK